LTLYPGTAHTLQCVTSLTTGQLAERAGVHIETVRYYERRGLLREPPRSEAGYRQYAPADLWRLQFITRAKGLGFTLTEIRALFGTVEEGSSDSVVEVAQAKMRALDERQRELSEIRSRLLRLIDICAGSNSEDCMALRITR
jgi:DNA-binding transcriptional MerR regulator